MDTDFARRLSDLRAQRRLSKSEFARQVGVSPTCVWNWEEGNTLPRSENFDAIAKALHVSPAYLAGESEPQHATGINHSTQKPLQSETPEGTNLGEVINTAKEAIARASGLPMHKIKISLDY